VFAETKGFVDTFAHVLHYAELLAVQHIMHMHQALAGRMVSNPAMELGDEPNPILAIGPIPQC